MVLTVTHTAAQGMNTTTSTTTFSRLPFGNGLISGYEIALLFCATVLLVAAYPAKHGDSNDTATVASLQTFEEPSLLMLEIKHEVEAQIAETSVVAEPTNENTTVKLDQIDTELLTASPSTDPAS